jgi:membrane-associated phospholipid phosphatase
MEAAIVPGERLSNWMLRSANPNADTTALHWRVQAERAPQRHLRQAVVEALSAQNQPSSWLLSLPLTGRLTVANADARWLQSAPQQDPILQDGHSVILLPRPAYVTVVTNTGQACNAAHVSGALIQDYLRACLGAPASSQVDWAWIAQPDGRTTQYGISPWSMTPQAEPGPGAWIWAPARQAGISNRVSDNLARFLATQLPGEVALPNTPKQTALLLQAPTPRQRNAQETASDWGNIGLLQTPTARMAPAGEVRFHLSQVSPYTHGTVMFQPFDWLETGFRYSDVSNRLYGASIAGGQSYKDKSIDLKLRIREESSLWPQLAVGLRDLGGTGLFAGEYLVANKRWGNWDASLGLGWGYMGARGNLKNPLSALGSQFGSRPANNVGQGGTPGLGAMFRGPTALFGGIQWHSPSDPWIFKVELDGNDYQHEPQDNNQPTQSPLNFGAVYRYSPNIDLSFGLQRGNMLMMGFTLHGGLNNVYSPKLLDAPLPPVHVQAPAALPPAGWQGSAESIELFTGWSVRSIAHDHITTTVVADTDTAVHLQERIDRAMTVLHRDAPAESTRFVLQLQERGLALTQVEVDRAEWVVQNTQVEAPALRLPAQRVSPGRLATAAPLAPAVPEADAARFWQTKSSRFSSDIGPSYSQILGGPDSFLLYQLGIKAGLEYKFSDRTWLSSAFNLRLSDNYANFVYDAPSQLPRVRTFQREYATTSALTIPLLQLTHAKDLGNGHYVSAYGGMLEAMYGGVGAEWLYRPWQGRLAWGVDVNHVRQRDFQQDLGFRDYKVNTGHATLYWDTGLKDLQVKLSAGRYLAGDMGATLDVNRVFSNGVKIGAWATKTNVSAAVFGEGSFDKGVYVNIPFDVMLPQSTPGSGSFVWNPLTRDGGARLGRSFNLDFLTRQRDSRALLFRAASPAGVNSAENTSYVLTDPSLNAFQKLGSTTTTLGRQLGDIPGSTWLWAGGAILASSLLDKPADKWAQKNQTGTASSIGSATNALPVAMALGAGLLYTGVGGEPAASTAETALTAAAYTYGINLATRFAVGRARPTQGQGNITFDGFTGNASQSGFASNHVATAFALVTPFAQQHDMPWLYGLAATTSFGRLQKREHWVSDTVAGAFLGYAIGSMLTDQHRQSGMRLNVTTQSVEANWAFN